MFAKLFETDIGQILVLKKRDDQSGVPVIQVFCEPAGLGTCNINLKYPDNETGWDKAEQAFAAMDESSARNALQPVLQMAPQVAATTLPSTGVHVRQDVGVRVLQVDFEDADSCSDSE